MTWTGFKTSFILALPLLGVGFVADAQARTLQEALTNVLKHAGASRITVRTTVDDAGRNVLISVADDGHGFALEDRPVTGPTPARTTGQGRGIANMRRRAEAVGGSLAILTSSEGTTVTLGLPVG